MGGSTGKKIKRGATFGIGTSLFTPKEVKGLDPGKGGRQARRTAAAQQKLLAEQKRKEDIKLAEQEDVIGRKKLLSKKGGRSLLVATSPTGMVNAGKNTTLGGQQ